MIRAPCPTGSANGDHPLTRSSAVEIRFNPSRAPDSRMTLVGVFGASGLDQQLKSRDDGFVGGDRFNQPRTVDMRLPSACRASLVLECPRSVKMGSRPVSAVAIIPVNQSA